MSLKKSANLKVAIVAFCLLPTTTALAAPEVPIGEPPVSKAAGAPCVVNLFTDQAFDDDYGTHNRIYSPPPGCPGPWTKVILKMDLSGSIGRREPMIAVKVAGVTLFKGMQPRTERVSSWHVERDLTEYASVLKQTNDLSLQPYMDYDSTNTDGDGTPIMGSAQLLFFRSTAATPANPVPDVVYTVAVDQNGDPLASLPHNIVRAYLDVMVVRDPLWFTCVPDESAKAYPALLGVLAPGINQPTLNLHNQGCTGGSFAEVEVSVDGTPAGMAQVFPWLPSELNGDLSNTMGKAAPSVQFFNMMPYRVDLTPFAAVLSEPGPHNISGNFDVYKDDAQLLLYLDHGKTRVTGAVTYNTLTDVPSVTMTNSLAAAADVLQGQVDTRSHHQFEIRGFVNTSHGRICTVLKQSGHFHNVQDFRLEGLSFYSPSRSYRQKVDLVNTVDRQSRRTQGGTVLSYDHERTRYPLKLDYATTGHFFDGDEGPTFGIADFDISVYQKRQVEGWKLRPGMPWYHTTLNDHFVANLKSGEPRSHLTSTRSYAFRDNFGSCYTDRLTFADGLLIGVNPGAGCASRTNHVRWFVHADGSPDALTWHP